MTKIDRFLVSNDFLESFSLAYAIALPRLSSDHTPLLLRSSSSIGGPKPFRLEIGWLDEAGVRDLIRKTWENSITFGFWDFQLHKKLLHLKHKLLKWKQENKYQLGAKIDSLLKDIKGIDQTVQSGGEYSKILASEIIGKINALNELRPSEEIYWRQRSQVKWLKEGDLNTKFFHSIANARRQQNDLSRLTI
ncbi:uncharacterized protein LOC105421540 [Amborella trichopoda]|uniref:uncharacterized protein LOC105421540 n=1 Tax=Amborella trichopoda TaxID=13333 RepID=UPI0005D3353A|nr:uncharacterized protein LOC105421540 [Amborella trichopoda]|eukprot:XP_011627592.1 uncharacterized protein LOC105421540 [Amborella trichopoda]